MNMIAELLSEKDILLDLEIASATRLLQEIARHMECRHGLPEAWVFLALSRREKVGSTALGEGVAVPHARIQGLQEIRVTYIRLKSPVPYDAPDGKPVSDILVILVPKAATEAHLRILAETSQFFSDAGFRQRLHACENVLEARRVFTGWSPAMICH